VTPEGQVVRDCLDYLAIRQIMAWRNNSGSTHGGKVHFGRVGSSDIIGLLPSGRFLAVECKAGRGKLTPEQAQFQAEIRNNGGLAITAYRLGDLIDALVLEARA